MRLQRSERLWAEVSQAVRSVSHVTSQGRLTQKIGRNDRDIFRTDICLGDCQAVHDGKGHDGTNEYLISNPFTGRRVDIEGH